MSKVGRAAGRMCQRLLKSAHERGVILRRNVNTNIKIVSGGQAGVDQGALEAAARLGLEFGARSQRGRSSRVQVARNTGEDEGVSLRGAAASG